MARKKQMAATTTPNEPNEILFNDAQKALEALVELGLSEAKSSEANQNNSNQKLYNALDAAYQFFLQASAIPEKDYKEFLVKKLGKYTLATTKSPFVAPLRLIFGSDQKTSSHRARYNLALQEVHRRKPKIDCLVWSLQQNILMTKPKGLLKIIIFLI